MTFEVLALGGNIDHGFGIQLPVPASSVASIVMKLGSNPAVSVAASPSETNLTIVPSQNMRVDLMGGGPAIINSKPGPERGRPDGGD